MENIVNRYWEKINTEKAAMFGITIDLNYFNEDNGVKISEYIESTDILTRKTSRKKRNLLLTSNLLKKLHMSSIKFENSFNVFIEIEKYVNYLENKVLIFNFKKTLENMGVVCVPCHNDAVPENFLKTEKNEIFLIDWEYSGLNDPMWDLATYSLESNLSLDEDRFFLQNYFKEENGSNFRNYGLDRYNRAVTKLKKVFNK